jgi:hypothetical protein
MSKNSITVGNVFTTPLPTAYRLSGFLLGLTSHPENGGSAFLRNVGGLLPDNTALHRGRYSHRYEKLKTMYHGTNDLLPAGILTDVTEYFCGIPFLWPRETRHSLAAL